MEKDKQLSVLVLEVTMIALLFFIVADCSPHNGQSLETKSPVKLDIKPEQVTINNGLFSITFSKPEGDVIGVSYGGVPNILATQNKEFNRGYWDIDWTINKIEHTQQFNGTNFEVITNNGDQAEISFTKTCNTSQPYEPPLNFDKRYIVLRDTPGFYTYSMVERLKEWPDTSIGVIRVVFKLQEDMFHYMAVSDERQRVMPTAADRINGKRLGFKEAILLTNPTNPDFKGEVDDKYFYSNDVKDGQVYGWISNTNPPLGFWMINPSNEYRTGGPFKQELTAHVGPTILSTFVTEHYSGANLTLKYGESWKKVFGPSFVYLNSNAAAKSNPFILWDDAKKRMNQEVANWPYEFPASNEYIKSKQRGTVEGQLFVYDWFVKKQNVPATNAYIGLALPGEAGSWQIENKGYQFWTKTDNTGKFVIKGVIPNTYNLYATVPGVIGDYKYGSDVKVTSGSNIKLGSLTYNPPRNGPTIWEIGVPDRTAAEFFIPNPPAKYKVHKYKNDFETKFRQYGLWDQYAALYPKNDLVYNVKTSNYSKDWFYAHVPRSIGVGKFSATTWSIIFELANVNQASNYTLQLALAAAQEGDVEVRVNDEKAPEPYYKTGALGKTNAIARHGIHGLYYLFSIEIQGKLFVKGKNTVFLKQSRALSPWEGVMYDYIRFEGPHK